MLRNLKPFSQINSGEEFKAAWKGISPIIEFIIGNVQMILEKLGSAIQLTVSVGANLGIVVEGKINVPAFSIGNAIFSGIMGGGLGTLSHFLQMIDKYVDQV